MTESKKSRLDSWKEVAEYLGRDLRTVARWEKDQGLPVHRVGGGRGRSVFAYAAEIDEWLTRTATKAKEVEARKSWRSRGPGRAALSGTALLIVAAILWFWPGESSKVARVSSGEGRVIAYDGKGNQRWTYTLARGLRMFVAPLEPSLVDLNGDGRNEILACVEGSQSLTGDLPTGGELLCLSEQGSVLWRYRVGNSIRIGNTTYEGPWPADYWTVIGSPPRTLIALTVHHYTSWPAILVVLDSSGKLIGEFVNSGWMRALKSLQRSSGPLLLAGGVSNSRDAGMLAVLDPEHLTGGSPEDLGSEYECRSCPPGKPLYYFVFPRSELNRMTASQYNRVNNMVILQDRIMVHTFEVDSQVAQTPEIIDGIYEFSPEMQLQRAYFNDRYWDLHRRLELEGKIRHSRAQCPERDGPVIVRSWSSEDGWKDIKLRKI